MPGKERSGLYIYIWGKVMKQNERSKLNILLRVIIPVIIALVIWILPTPEGLSSNAWHVFAIFVAVIVAMITRPIPDMESVAVLCGLTAVGILGLASVSDIFSGYGSSTPWLILSAFLICVAFLKTGFATRLAYLLIRALGKNVLGVTYALGIADFIVGPATPSTTARSAGIILPVASGVMKAYGSEPLPSPTAKKIGRYLCLTLPHITMMTSATFITAMIANPLIVNFAKQILGVEISWTTWTIAALPITILGIIVIPIVYLYLVKPELRKTPEAPIEAQKRLKEMGPMSRPEKVCLFTFVLAIVLWATGQLHGIDATIIGFLAGVILIAGGAIAWDDVARTKAAWNTVFWLAGMTSLAGILNKLGFFKWVANGVVGAVGTASAITIFTVLVLVVAFTGYGFASLTARVSAIIPAFLGVISLTPLNPVGATLAMGYAISFGGILTHFSAASSPPWYGLEYLTFTDWLKNSFIMEIILLAILIGVGIPYWSMLGLW
jgi:DASS family divalent anion:Na+ symporter